MANEKSVLIIGAGLAGLSAGIYARLNGYPAAIIEMHDLPGGLVTAWKRGDYLVDGCITHLAGSNPAARCNQMWRELGAAQDRQFLNPTELLRVRNHEGREAIFYANLDRLEQHLLSLAPGDASPIRELVSAARAMAAYDPPLDPPSPLTGLGEMGRMRRWQETFDRYSRVTVAGFCKRFDDPFLSQAILSIAPPDAPMSAVLGKLAALSNQDLGYPLGGSLALARAVERRFLDLGGEILYQARVDQVLTTPGKRGDRAAGLHMDDGRILEGDWVINAGDGRTAVYTLLNSQYLNESVRARFNDLPLTPPVTQVALGVRYDLSGEPLEQVDLFRQPLYLAGRNQAGLSFRHYALDPAVAPPGRTVVLARLPADYDYWQAMEFGSTRYEMAKEAKGRALIAHLEQRYPGIEGRVEMVDVATPLTYEHFTGTYHGVSQSFALTPETVQFSAGGMNPTLPGLAGFFQIGQWTRPGGGAFPAARSGRDIIRTICRLDGRRFTGGSHG